MILDAAVGHIIGKVDLVLVGAEGVVESGGIVNKVIFFYFINFYIYLFIYLLSLSFFIFIFNFNLLN